MSSPRVNPQGQQVLDYIREFGSITPLDGFRDLGVTRLAARIHELKQVGYKFDTEMEQRKNRFGKLVEYARYRLKETA